MKQSDRLPSMLKQTMLYGAGIAIMKGVSLLMLPLVTYYLQPEDYGRLEVLTSLATLTSVVVGFGLANALFRFSSLETGRAGEAQAAADGLGLASWFTVAAISIALVIAPVLAGLLPGGLSEYEIRIILLTIAFEGIIAIPLAWLRLNDHAFSFFLINTGKAILQAGLTLYLLMLGRGVAGVVEAGFIAALVQASLLFFLQLRRTGINLAGQRFKDMLVYGAPLVGSGLVLFMINGVDRWILADQVGNAQMAQYAIAAKFALAANLLIQPYVMWWMPRRFHVVKQPQGTQRAAYYALMGVTLVILVGFIVSSGADLLMELLLPDAYSQSRIYVIGLVLIVVLKESAELLNLGCFVGDHTHAQLIINIIVAVLAFTGLWVLVPIMGVAGALLALTLAQTIRLTLYLAVSQRVMRLPYRYAHMIQYIAVSVIVILIGQQLPSAWIKAAYVIPGSLVMLMAAMRLKLIPIIRLPGTYDRLLFVKSG